MLTPKNISNWASNRSYVTGDVFSDLMEENWTINDVEREKVGRAKLYRFTLTRNQESIDLRVLDCPIAREAAQNYN